MNDWEHGGNYEQQKGEEVMHLCKVVIKTAWPFSLFQGHLFGLFLHIHRKHF